MRGLAKIPVMWMAYVLRVDPPTPVTFFSILAGKCWQLLAWRVEKSKEHSKISDSSKFHTNSIVLFQDKMKTLIYLGRD